MTADEQRMPVDFDSLDGPEEGCFFYSSLSPVSVGLEQGLSSFVFLGSV